MSAFEKFFVNRSSDRTARGLVEMLREAISLPSGVRVLELGAGTGALSYLLYRSYAPSRLVVSDYDPSQVSLAGSYLQDKLGGVPEGVEIRKVDALSLPFGDGSFDAVFASHVLHHVEKREWHFRNVPRALNEIYRVLKVDGLFVYEEIFNKSKIQEYLVGLGFELVFEKRNWPGNHFCIFKKNP